MTRRHFLATTTAFAALLAFAPFAKAADGDIFAPEGVALKGYDPVAYFQQNAAVKGNPSISQSWSGVTWHFASEDNRAAFEAAPARYAPQYGGYCAYAAARGSLAPSDPEAFTVYNGKLYLNFSKSVRERWLEDRDAYIAQADANWPDL